MGKIEVMNNCKYVGYYKSPIGYLKLTSIDDCITGLKFSNEYGEENINDTIIECKKELDYYFDGRLKEFKVKTKLIQGTDFQKKVWNALKEIPYGQIVSYKYIGEKIENPKAVRAVGGANNKNPISIIIPCHRVVGANGKLVGYAGGLDVKEYLINLEKENKY